MTDTLTYEQTIELEKNVVIKNRAEKIYKDFLANVRLAPAMFKDGRFLFWSDSHNAIFIAIVNGEFEFQCRFLHETYNVKVTPSGIFEAIKNTNKGVEHLESTIRKQITPSHYDNPRTTGKGDSGKYDMP